MQSQSCAVSDDMMKVTGTWKKNEDFIEPGKKCNPEIKAEIYKRLNNIQQVIQSAYSPPKGSEVHWSRNIMGTPLARSNCATYSLSVMMFEDFCDVADHKLKHEDETDNLLDVYVNFPAGYFFFDTTMRIGHMYVAQMYYRVGKIKDVDLFQTSLVRGNSRFIIIARNGQLPYIPLTRKQYLGALKTKFINEEKWMIERSFTGKNEADKLRSEQYWKGQFDPKIKRIDDYLSSATEDDLNQLAFVKDMLDFKKFYTEQEGGRMTIIVNKDYFNNTLDPFTPQFFLMRWEWNDGEGPAGGLLKPKPPDMNVCCRISKYYKESIENNLDVAALRQMLDK
ncbi:MAG: hypothetical protein JST75_08485 [Bacteroidetes bacterium]|nr:hypothetical protein [Bacteroidota bacterium]